MTLPPIGHEFSFQGDTFTIGFISNKTVRYTSVAGGRQHTVPLETFLQMSSSRDFENLNNDWDDAFSHYGKEDIAVRNQLFSIIKFVEANTNYPRSEKRVTPLLDAYANKHKTKVISFSNFAKKHKKYVEAGYNINALLPKHHLKGNRKRSFGSSQEAKAREIIECEYLKVNGATLRDAYVEFKDQLHDSHEFHQDPINHNWMSFSTFRRRCLSYDISDHLAAKYGNKRALKKLKAAGKKLDTGFPLQYVEADGYYVDCKVVDGSTGEEMGRPYLTLFIDRATRSVLSYHLSLRAFCVDTLLVAFRDALRQDNNLPGGRISYVIVDNGSDFKSHAFQSAILSVAADLKPNRIDDPNSKPFVESVFRTFNLRCFHYLSGTTFSNPEQRGDYDSESEAIYTIEELDEIFGLAVEQYHLTIHSQLGKAPRVAWEDWLEKTEGLTNEVPLSEINQYLRDVKQYKPNKGQIRFLGLSYMSHDLRGIEETLKLRKQNNKALHVYIDNADLSHVYVENPLDANAPLIKAISTEPEYTQGLTMYEHKENRQEKHDELQSQRARLERMGADAARREAKKRIKEITRNAEHRKQKHSENSKKQKRAAESKSLDNHMPSKSTRASSRFNETSHDEFSGLVWGDDDE